MRTSLDVLRSMHRYLWRILEEDIPPLWKGEQREWEIRFWGDESEFQFPFARVAAITPTTYSGSAVIRECTRTFAWHLYPVPMPTPEESLMEVERVEELLATALEQGFTFFDAVAQPMPQLSPSGGPSSLPPSTYYYAVSALGAHAGETLAADAGGMAHPPGSVLSWVSVKGANRYVVYRSDDGGTTWQALHIVDDVGTPTHGFTDDGNVGVGEGYFQNRPAAIAWSNQQISTWLAQQSSPPDHIVSVMLRARNPLNVTPRIPAWMQMTNEPWENIGVTNLGEEKAKLIEYLNATTGVLGLTDDKLELVGRISLGGTDVGVYSVLPTYWLDDRDMTLRPVPSPLPSSRPVQDTSEGVPVSGFPDRVPLYDYFNVPLGGHGSVSHARGPRDYVRVLSCSINRIVDPEDDNYWLVIVELRVTWRRAGRVIGSSQVVQRVQVKEAAS